MSFASIYLAVALSAPELPASHGYLYQPSYEMDQAMRTPAAPYRPEPGDIYLATTKPLWSRVGHWLAGGSTGPHHSGIVVRRPDGKAGILEAGPFNTLRVNTLELMEDLVEHERREEIVWIRKRRTPMTAEQSACLTEWAMAQEGKRFAWVRLLGQLTIFRCRGPVRTWVVGGPHGERSSYFCAELVMETLVHTGLIAHDKARPSATYPRDMFFDRSPIPFINQNTNLSSGWYPPSRWSSQAK